MTAATGQNRIGAIIARMGKLDLAQRLRLITGLTLFTFIITHFLNHALGLVSLDVMMAGQRLFFAVWHSLPGSALLVLALVTHLTLVLYKQVVRHTLRMPWVEGLRIILGIVTLYALLLHAAPQLVYRVVYGTPVLYPDFLLGWWPEWATKVNQLVLVTAAWTHGCIGIHFWLRLRATYRRIVPALCALAVLLPILALLGIVVGERAAEEKANDPKWMAAIHANSPAPAADTGWLRFYAFGGATGLVVLLVAMRVSVQAWERRKGQVTVRYPGGRQITATRGSTVLEMSNMGRIPHAAVCGGRGRCSTCRVHIDSGWEMLPTASEEEHRLLQRIRAPERVRLACQLRPVADVAVSPLVSPNARARDARPFDRMLFGMEQEIVILFSDLRGFTKMSETKLPYDVVHILNQYFAEMGEAIESAGGYLDKFIGDGIMALFGLQDGVQQGALNALAAAKMMAQRLEEMNARLSLDLATPLKLGIGIHVGHVIVGEMGYKRATSLTAIGDSVNVASRLESATKVAECQLLVSEEVARKGKVDLSAFSLRSLKVRGREEPLRVFIIPTAAELPDWRSPQPQRGGGVVGGAARPA